MEYSSPYSWVLTDCIVACYREYEFLWSTRVPDKKQALNLMLSNGYDPDYATLIREAPVQVDNNLMVQNERYIYHNKTEFSIDIWKELICDECKDF